MDNKELNKKIFEAVYSIAKDEFKRIEIVPGAYSLDQVLKLGISPDDGTEKIVQIGDYRLNFPVKSVFVVLDRLKSLPGTPKKIQFIKEDEADNVVCSFFIEVEKDHKDVCSPLLKGKNDKDVCKHVYINPIKGIIIGTNGYTIIDKLTHITGIKGNTESANIYISPKDFKKLRGRVFVEHMEKKDLCRYSRFTDESGNVYTCDFSDNYVNTGFQIKIKEVVKVDPVHFNTVKKTLKAIKPVSGYELITFIANKGWNELILRFDGGSEIKVPISGIFKSTFSRTIKTGLFKQVLNVWGGVISFKRLNEINAIDFGTDNRAFVVCYGDSAYIYDYDQPGEVDGSPADHESDRTTSRTTGDPAERPNDFGETEPNDRTTGETTERPAEQVETDKAVDEQADVCVPSCEYEQTNETGNETDQIKDHRNLPSCDFDPNTCIQYILSLSTIICFISEWIIRSEIEKTLLRLDFLKNLIRDNTFIESDKEQAETGEKHANFECSACLSEQTNDNIANIEDTGVPDVPKAVIETVFIYETGCTHKAKGSYASIDIAAPWIFHQNNTNTVCLREQQAYTYIQTHVWRCKVFHPVQNKHSPYDIACKPPVFVKFAMSENRRPGNRYERKRATEYFTMSGFGVPGKFNSNETFYHERKQGTRLNGIVKIRGSTCF